MLLESAVVLMYRPRYLKLVVVRKVKGGKETVAGWGSGVLTRRSSVFASLIRKELAWQKEWKAEKR